MLWAEEAARAEPRGENELGRSEEQREPCGFCSLVGAAGREELEACLRQPPGHREASLSPRKSRQRF